jgi:MFS family permease
VLRIIGVTLLVSLLGALAGAVAAVLVAAVAMEVLDKRTLFFSARELLLIVSMIGVIVGGFFAPLTTWLFLRRVPLWRASVETSFAATIGFAIGAVLGGSPAIAGAAALGGALLAALRLKRAFRVKEQALETA